MERQGVEALLIVQRVDLFYFTGTAQNGVLFLPGDGEPLLFIKKYLPRAQQESSLKHVLPLASLRDLPNHVRDLHGRLPRVLGLEFDVLPVKEYLFIAELFAASTCVDATDLILTVRARKSPWEIAQMDHTAEVSARTFAFMREVLRPGLTEMEFAGLYETFARRHGHGARLQVRNYQALGYPWHVLSGRSGGMVGLLDSPASGEGTSAAFPCGAGHKELAANEPIMVDFGSVVNGFHMDETRMFAIGAMPEEAARACRAAIEIHDAVLARITPGSVTGDLFAFACQRAADLGYADVFLGPRGHQVAFIGHGIGHELIEPPFIARGRREPLEPGMTLALEPKMVFEDRFAAGIESVFEVTAGGARLISRVPVQTFVC